MDNRARSIVWSLAAAATILSAMAVDIWRADGHAASEARRTPAGLADVTGVALAGAPAASPSSTTTTTTTTTTSTTTTAAAAVPAPTTTLHALGAAAPTSGAVAPSTETAEAALLPRHVWPWPAASTPSPRAVDGSWSVLYLGDSMAVTTGNRLRSLLPSWGVEVVAFGGTAPCDWVGRRELLDAIERAQPDLIAFSFIGNSLTPCTGQQQGQALLDQYESNLLDICAAAAPARCIAVGQPVLDPGVARTLPGPDEPNTMFLEHALSGAWGFVDAGAAAETPTGTFDVSSRSGDGVHFSEQGAAAYAHRIAEFLEVVAAG